MLDDVPVDIRARGPEAVQEYENGHYAGARWVACQRLRDDYGPAALSRLPEGDERGKLPPGPEALTWMRKAVGYQLPDLFHEGGVLGLSITTAGC